ncbi:hypothetical protein NDU88_005124 [Pleurodeles waltl]|uniref:Uncharacterized protein n=1 Tax=Pleurodeles waltl TaxID=8319 RepID=A0AAV7TBM4_PLEWA|nr:hypothetical protein NDU88_005124 [Pleurodeles waltl]
MRSGRPRSHVQVTQKKRKREATALEAPHAKSLKLKTAASFYEEAGSPSAEDKLTGIIVVKKDDPLKSPGIRKPGAWGEGPKSLKSLKSLNMFDFFLPLEEEERHAPTGFAKSPPLDLGVAHGPEHELKHQLGEDTTTAGEQQ